ncbi:MAG: formylglycine-generating enzyme family protein [Actinomycetota bacterium]|nr:formylglycine-generating enzyme family protein [Actinomycetota bacterium]
MTGARENCLSAWGARDMIGNVDEWVGDWDELAEGCRDWSLFSDDRSCVGGDISNNLPSALLRGGHFT